MEPKILITGGTGKLAQELKKHLAGEYVGIEHWDFVYGVPRGEYDLIVHMGAYTNVALAEKEPQKCFDVNAKGTFNLVQAYPNTPFVYISTEYAHNPLGVYALSKLIGEEIVKTHPAHLIMRISFKPRPWPFEVAYIDQWTRGDYTDVIAKLVAEKILSWDRKTSEFAHVGTERKTIFDLARETRPDVKPNSVKDHNTYLGKELIPHDYA